VLWGMQGGIVALALILFEGGLASGWAPIRSVLRPALGLATVGTLVTALTTGSGAALIFGFPIPLYPVASIAAATTAFGAGQFLHGSGFLAVYLAGLTIGSTNAPAARTVQTFHDGLAWVAQIVLFLSLGLLVFPSQLPAVALEGLAITALLLVVAADRRVRRHARLAFQWPGDHRDVVGGPAWRRPGRPRDLPAHRRTR